MNIAVCGLGEMGAVIAQRLVQMRAHVTGYDPIAKPASVPMAATVRDAVFDATVVVVVVRDMSQAEALLFGSDGVAENCPRGAVVVIHSTLSPHDCRSLESRLASRGVALLDAPMSRGQRPMSDGCLSLFIGGDQGVLEKVRGVLELYSDNIRHVGELGAGMVYKLCNNMLLHANRHILLEVSYCAQELGVTAADLRSVLASATGSSWVMSHWSTIDDSVISGAGAKDVALVERTERELRLGVAMFDDAGVRAGAAKGTLALSTLLRDGAAAALRDGER